MFNCSSSLEISLLFSTQVKELEAVAVRRLRAPLLHNTPNADDRDRDHARTISASISAFTCTCGAYQDQHIYGCPMTCWRRRSMDYCVWYSTTKSFNLRGSLLITVNVDY